MNTGQPIQTIDVDSLTYFGKGKDHIVFAYKDPSLPEPNLVVKIKQNLNSKNKDEMTVIKNQKDFYKQLNNKWFGFVRSFELADVFPDLRCDIRLPISAIDIEKVNAKLQEKNLKVSKDFDILLSSNLFYEAKDFGHKSFFIETKPKSLIKFSFNHAQVDMMVPGIRKDPRFWDVYNTKIKNKQYTRRAIYNKLQDPAEDDYLFFNEKVFVNTIKKYGGTKYFDYKRYNDDRGKFGKYKPEEMHSYLGMSEKQFNFMLQRAFFYKHDVLGQKKDVFNIFRTFQNLFTYPVSIFKSHLDKIADFNYSEETMDPIFEKAKKLIMENKRAHINPLEFIDKKKLLEAFVFMLISQVISDASLIIHVVFFDDKAEAEAFVEKMKGYFVQCVNNKYVVFKFNLIDTEMKRFKKIFTYFSNERNYMEYLFGIEE